MALNKELLASLAGVSRDMSESSTLPPACYYDPAVHQLETAHLLRESWLGVGRSDRWPNPGDYAALDLGGVPTMVLRDQQRRLRAFANTCRHRGTQLVRDEGNTARIVCPFHGWTYGLDGTLRGATRMDHAKGFRREDFGLIEFRAAEHAGFAFVCMHHHAPNIDTWLGDFDAHHAPWPLDNLVTTRRRELEVSCNWKAFLEVFNEGYHLDFVHP